VQNATKQATKVKFVKNLNYENLTQTTDLTTNL